MADRPGAPGSGRPQRRGQAEILAQSVELAVEGKLASFPGRPPHQGGEAGEASLIGKDEVALEFEPDEYGVREMTWTA